ncbi:DnaB-like helicase C-terminal domain-containing protein [Streptomyces canus]|uniref:DnaB-like helicase C-terminal domain-containing protein n=1 Tax=Streptomyces canus TaxID=58343 RepID=UPI0033AB7D17
MPTVAISTLNRSPEQRTDRKPMINDLRYSGPSRTTPTSRGRLRKRLALRR